MREWQSQRGPERFEVLKHHLAPGSDGESNLWKIVRRTYPDGRSETFIALDLIACRGVWGYKDLSEHMGPYETNCPVEWLDEVPCPGDECAVEFRRRVRAANPQQQPELFAA
jgi:hypothetical protein